MVDSFDFSDITPIKGSDLRAMRMVSGLTTIQMAQAAGVKTRKTYENWEKDVGTPNVNQFFEMVRKCGFDLNAFALFTQLKLRRQIVKALTSGEAHYRSKALVSSEIAEPSKR